MIDSSTTLLGKEERAILVGTYNRENPFDRVKEYIEELAFLAGTAGIRSLRSFIQKVDKPYLATYVGTGKLQEIADCAAEQGADIVIFDDELSPKQIYNIEQEIKVRVIDRSALILHIFSLHARSSQARAQVELAQWQYLLPRLVGMWTHLERQRGGTGTRGGAGEKEIETDRRIIRNRIERLKEELITIDKQTQQTRKGRDQFVRVALVGYTNVGKSTIMNLITKADVLVENKLFATLDTTVRKVVMDYSPFLLSDTVGFIHKLPHHLVECFKSTLSEAREADILLHVVDVSHPRFEHHIEVVKNTLGDVGVKDKMSIIVFNKADLLTEEERARLEETWFGKEHAPAVFVSALQNWNIDNFKNAILAAVRTCEKQKFPDRVSLYEQIQEWGGQGAE